MTAPTPTRPPPEPTAIPADPNRALAWVFRETALFALTLLFRVYPDMKPDWWGRKSRRVA